MNTRFTIIGLALAALSAPAISGAVNPGPPAFAELDLDGNGQVTQQEYEAARTARHEALAQQGYPLRHAGHGPAFAQIDADADGQLSADEFAAHRAAMQAGRPCRRMGY